MGTGPPRLRRRLIIASTLLATAGLVGVPTSRADTGTAGAAVAAVAAAVPAPAEPAVTGLVESVPAPEPVPPVSVDADPRPVVEVIAAAAAATAAAVADVGQGISSARAIPTAQPRAAVITRASGTASRPNVRPERALKAKPPSRTLTPTVGRELGTTRKEPVAVPPSTGSERVEARRAAGPQHIPAPTAPGDGASAAGATSSFAFVIVATVVALFFALSGLGTRISLRLARPPSAALAPGLERPG